MINLLYSGHDGSFDQINIMGDVEFSIEVLSTYDSRSSESCFLKKIVHSPDSSLRFQTEDDDGDDDEDVEMSGFRVKGTKGVKAKFVGGPLPFSTPN
jgi:hypothetical protein